MFRRGSLLAAALVGEGALGLGVRRHSGPAALGGGAVAGRPPLLLGFEAQVLLERRPSEGGPSSAEHHVAVDGRGLRIARIVPEASRSAAFPGVVFDVGRGVRTDAQRFFDETVCFDFDLDVGGGRSGAPSVDSKAMVQAFESIASETLGIPLYLYPLADHARGPVDLGGGVACSAWEARHEVLVPVPRSGEGLRALAERFQLPKDSQPKLVSAVGAQLKVTASATFCVDTAGLLRAANVSASATLVAPRHRSAVLRTDATHALLRGARALGRGGAEAFAIGRRATGGRCLDLRSGPDRSAVLHGDVNDGPRLAQINTEARGAWEASSYEGWRGATVSEVRGLLGTEMRPPRLMLRRPERPCGASVFEGGCPFAAGPAQEAPQEFDARERWPSCASLRRIRNQGHCGSCCAVAAASVLADRFCIAAAAINVSGFGDLISPQYLLDCSGADGGCGGGLLDDAWEFLRDQGAPAEACDPYAFCPNQTDAQCGLDDVEPAAAESPRRCPSACAPDTAGDGPFGAQRRGFRSFRAGHVYAVSRPGDVAAMQREMVQHGPIEAAFFVFSDFYSYKQGTYFRTRSAVGPLGGHAVRLLGWGVDEHETEYWLVANSFGPAWGMGGFFRIRRGTNECGIETMPAAGVPQLPTAADGWSQSQPQA